VNAYGASIWQVDFQVSLLLRLLLLVPLLLGSEIRRGLHLAVEPHVVREELVFAFCTPELRQFTLSSLLQNMENMLLVHIKCTAYAFRWNLQERESKREREDDATHLCSTACGVIV
jgi:hypothetical protein